jgi:prepilin peptidase CpaA
LALRKKDLTLGLIITSILAAILGTVAAVTDLRSRRIPNWLTLPALLSGMLANTLIYGWRGVAQSGKGVLLGVVLLLPFVLLHSLGMGDLKLVIASGAILGPSDLITVLLLQVILAGIIAVAVIVRTGRVSQTIHNIGHILGSLLAFRMPGQAVSLDNPQASKIPFGVAMGLAMVIYCAHQLAGKI